MPKFVIERNIPGAGAMSVDEVSAMIDTSCKVVKAIGPQIEWIESYVTGDKLYCIYIAPDEETIRQHAVLGGFPADSILMVRKMVGPSRIEALS